MKLLSLCMPTNGIKEWVFPALDSIFNQNTNSDLFEVVVTDNGNNPEFYREMCDYQRKYSNIIYERNNSVMFENQLEALKLATGEYLKFVNHRSIWLEDRLKMMLDFVEKNLAEKPVIYFSNGVMGWGPVHKEYDSFDLFVRNLRRFASWTSGVGVWREDYIKLPPNFQYDKISPHSSILFAERKKRQYIINDVYWMKEITGDHSKKGTYDLYKAFGVEELSITLDLYKSGDITAETFKYVKRDYGEFLKELYYLFNIKKDPCSYDLSGFDDNMDIFFLKDEIINGAYDIARGKEQS